MIRVLHCVGGMTRDGLETFIMNMYRKVNRREIQFDFAVYAKERCAYDDEIESLGGKIFRIVPRNESILRNINSWESFMKAHAKDYAAVHCHVSSLTNIQPLISATKYGVKVRIVHSHNTKQDGLLHNMLHKFNKLIIKNYVTDILACSDLAGIWLVGNKTYKTGIVQLMQNGIDADEFEYSEEKRIQIREEIGINDEYLIGHVGRFMKVKNHRFIIEIFNELLKLEPNARLILVGCGELESCVKEQVAKCGIDKKVLFLGVRNDIPKIMSAIDVFLMPSLFEGLPVVGIEAQAAGLKCYFSDNITKQVSITDLAEFLSLDLLPSEWASIILCKARDYKRKSTKQEITRAGFDSADVCNRLVTIYKRG